MTRWGEDRDRTAQRQVSSLRRKAAGSGASPSFRLVHASRRHSLRPLHRVASLPGHPSTRSAPDVPAALSFPRTDYTRQTGPRYTPSRGCQAARGEGQAVPAPRHAAAPPSAREGAWAASASTEPSAPGPEASPLRAGISGAQPALGQAAVSAGGGNTACYDC